MPVREANTVPLTVTFNHGSANFLYYNLISMSMVLFQVPSLQNSLIKCTLCNISPHKYIEIQTQILLQMFQLLVIKAKILTNKLVFLF